MGTRSLAAAAAVLGMASNPYQPVAYTPYISVALYGAGLAAEPQAPPPQPAGDLAKRLDAIEKKLDALLDLLSKLLNDEEPAKQEQANADPFLSAAGKCIVCHENAAVAKVKGEGFVLFEQQKDGAHFRKFSDRDVRAIRKELTRKTMPPDGNKDKVPPLTEAERSALLDAIK